MKKTIVLGVMALFALNIAMVQNVNAQDTKKVKVTTSAADTEKKAKTNTTTTTISAKPQATEENATKQPGSKAVQDNTTKKVKVQTANQPASEEAVKPSSAAETTNDVKVVTSDAETTTSGTISAKPIEKPVKPADPNATKQIKFKTAQEKAETEAILNDTKMSSTEKAKSVYSIFKTRFKTAEVK